MFNQQSLTNWLTNSVTLWRRSGVLRQTPSLWSSPNRLMSSAMRINDNNDWPVHSLMFSHHGLRGLLCDDFHLLFHVVWFLIAYRDGGRGRTTLTCDAWRLTVKVPDVQRGYWPIAIHIYSKNSRRIERTANKLQRRSFVLNPGFVFFISLSIEYNTKYSVLESQHVMHWQSRMCCDEVLIKSLCQLTFKSRSLVGPSYIQHIHYKSLKVHTFLCVNQRPWRRPSWSLG